MNWGLFAIEMWLLHFVMALTGGCAWKFFTDHDSDWRIMTARAFVLFALVVVYGSILTAYFKSWEEDDDDGEPPAPAPEPEPTFAPHNRIFGFAR